MADQVTEPPPRTSARTVDPPPAPPDEEFPPGYPEEWEADVVLIDGSTCHLRPIKPSDRDALQAMHLAQSARSVYLRFFAPMPRLSERDLDRFTQVDYNERVALIALVQDRIVGVGRYDLVDRGEAEVAFNIADSFQGRGMGSVLLEHLAAAARERSVTRFVAEVLPENRKMVRVFTDAGYEVKHHFDDGVISLEFDIKPTEKSIEVMTSREHRAEAASLRALLNARSVAVLGASTRPEAVGNVVVRNILAGGYTGKLYPIHPDASDVCGMRSYAHIGEIGEPVDLAIISLPVDAVLRAAAECGDAGVRGLVVITDGFADSDVEGQDREALLTKICRAGGMRLLGPASLGLVNTDPAVRLNGSVMPVPVEDGGLGMFSQSGGLGLVMLAEAAERGLTVSSFVSAGNRADVSGNDLLQFWEEDPRTKVVAMYTESSGNPRKFFRIARHVTRTKPVVLVRSWVGGAASAPLPGRLSQAPREAFDALMRQAGVVRVDDIRHLMDVVEVLADQPLPRGHRVAILANTPVVASLVEEACASRGLSANRPVVIPLALTAEECRAGLEMAVGDDAVGEPAADCLVVALVPPLAGFDKEVLDVLGVGIADRAVPTVSCLVAHKVLGQPVKIAGVPTYDTPEDAVRALAAAGHYGEWQRRDHGVLVDPPGTEPQAARDIVERALAAAKHPSGTRLGPQQTRDLLSCYGIHMTPAERAVTEDEVLEAAERLGFPVALKYADQVLRERRDISGARLGIDDEAELLSDFASMAKFDDPAVAKGFIVQPMVGAGVAVKIKSIEDPLFGPIISFGLTGDATELLGDVGYRIPPLTDMDVEELVRSVKASPRLRGYRGTPALEIAALHDVIARVSRMADDLPELAELELKPLLVTQTGVEPLWAKVRVATPPFRADTGLVRRLSTYRHLDSVEGRSRTLRQ